MANQDACRMYKKTNVHFLIIFCVEYKVYGMRSFLVNVSWLSQIF